MILTLFILKNIWMLLMNDHAFEATPSLSVPWSEMQNMILNNLIRLKFEVKTLIYSTILIYQIDLCFYFWRIGIRETIGYKFWRSMHRKFRIGICVQHHSLKMVLNFFFYCFWVFANAKKNGCKMFHFYFILLLFT